MGPSMGKIGGALFWSYPALRQQEQRSGDLQRWRNTNVLKHTMKCVSLLYYVTGLSDSLACKRKQTTMEIDTVSRHLVSKATGRKNLMHRPIGLLISHVLFSTYED